MQLKPVKIKEELGFPTINEFAQNPELLYKNIPSSWLKNKYVAASLAMFVLCGNASKSQVEKKENIDFVLQEKQNKEQNEEKKISKEVAKVAPVFAHGEGSGAIGCIVVSPPAFLTEQEALKIIFDELLKEGIEIDSLNYPSLYFKMRTKNILFRKSFDGFSSKYNLAIEFISKTDCGLFREGGGGGFSIQGFKTKSSAELLVKELNTICKNNVVVFYDPLTEMIYSKENKQKSRELIYNEAKETSKELLLAQVQDFIQWLKDEGILEK